jgi:hypothetical protein
VGYLHCSLLASTVEFTAGMIQASADSGLAGAPRRERATSGVPLQLDTAGTCTCTTLSSITLLPAQHTDDPRGTHRLLILVYMWKRLLLLQIIVISPGVCC